MVYTRIHQYLPEPSLQSSRHLVVPVLLKLVHVLEELDKPLIHNFFHIFYLTHVPVTDTHGIVLQKIIHLLLAASFVEPATLN